MLERWRDTFVVTPSGHNGVMTGTGDRTMGDHDSQRSTLASHVFLRITAFAYELSLVFWVYIMFGVHGILQGGEGWLQSVAGTRCMVHNILGTMQRNCVPPLNFRIHD